MELPIELFGIGIIISIGLALLGLIRQPQIPALMSFGGIFILFLSIMTDTIIMDYFSNGSTDDINEYNVQSSTGQILINSVSGLASGERLTNTSSELEGKTIDCITVFLGRSGSPPSTTLITVGVMDTSTQFISVFGTMNVTSLVSSANTPYQFCLPIGTTYTFVDTETVGIKWNSGDATNTLTSRIDANNPFDGNNTERVNSTTGTNWSASAGQDLMMIMTLRGETGIITSADFTFTELPKTFFALVGSIFMLSGVIMLYKEDKMG